MNGTLETNTHFFEGVEKNLEVWFTNSDRNTAEADLRKIPRLVHIGTKDQLNNEYKVA